jgi:hypothetical protein
VFSKRVVLSGLALVALATAGIAYSATSPSAKLAKQDRLYGGGQFGPGTFSDSTLYFAEPRNFAVDAHAEGDGSGAVGNSTYGDPGRFEEFRNVTCEQVDGNRASIGGQITSGSNAGFYYVQYFVDRGGPAFGDRDLASPAFIDTLDSPDWPAGFPNTCPPPTGTPSLPAIYLPITAGDVVVQDAASS